MDTKNINSDLTCVLFPGVVKNDDKAIECLGGIRNISEVYSQSSKKRLSLSFQPQNPYVNKIFADSKKTAGVLLKVKVKKTVVDNEVKREVVSTSVVGRVKQVYKFDSLCDFQYLPVATDTRQRCILEEILPSGLDSADFLKLPAPPFIVLSSFTRSDKPFSYTYTDKKYDEKSPNEDQEANVHYKIREDRKHPFKRYVFSLVDDMPTHPDQFFVDQINSKTYLKSELEIVKKLFDDRPIWSTNAIRYNTKIKQSSLKLILPCVAISMKNGPWRMLWVRYGYDPRKDPGARVYQCLDFRLRQDAGINSFVTTREGINYYRKIDRVRRLSKKKVEESTNSEEVPEGAVYFRPGMAPAQRQIYYQYCDVKLPEVEALLSAEPAPGALCHATRGWLPPDAPDTCRDYIFSYAKRALLASHNADVKSEAASSSEEDDQVSGEADVNAD